MSYYTATASTVNTLLTALQNGCRDKGWSVLGSLIYKDNCAVEVAISGSGLRVIGGTGISGITLAGKMVVAGSITPAASLSGIGQTISYPLTYHLHVFDKEVYLLVNYNVDNWSYMAFGQSGVAGISGTGNWYGGTGVGGDNYTNLFSVKNDGGNGHLFSMLFATRSVSGTVSNQTPQINSFFHHGLDNNEWSCSGEQLGSKDVNSWSGLPCQASASLVTYPLLNRQPNNYNGEAILLPITPAVYHKDSSNRVIVGDLKYARYTRIDNYEPGQIITLGDTQYKVYPWLKKNSSVRNGENYNYDVTTVQHSGTFGVAIVYEDA